MKKHSLSLLWQRCSVAVILTAAVGTLTGCAMMGYRLGSTLPADIKTVFVPAFINKTGEPMVDTEATKAAIQELQKDGSLEVTEEQYADTILTVSLIQYKLQPVSFEMDSRKTANEYRLYLTADVVFQRAKTNKLLSKKRVVGETTFLPSGDLSSAKRTALPLVARDLAHRIVEAVVEYW
jgi:hypothetical protein